MPLQGTPQESSASQQNAAHHAGAVQMSQLKPEERHWHSHLDILTRAFSKARVLRMTGFVLVYFKRMMLGFFSLFEYFSCKPQGNIVR